MVTAQSSTPDSCAYCDAPVESERAYRRHLNAAHDPSELGAIDRRRYEQYRPTPSVVVRAGSALLDVLTDLRYPVDAETGIRYATYGVACSIFVAALLGVWS